MNYLKKFRRAVNGHVLIVTFLIGLFATVLIGVELTLSNAEASVKEALAVVVFLQSGVSDADANSLSEAIKTGDPEVLSVSYTSKDQAYQEALKNPNLAKSLLLLKTNPLPASLTLRYTDHAWGERQDPSGKLKGLPAIQEIRWDPQARSIFRSLHRWRMWALRFSGFVGMVLFVWAFMGIFRFLALRQAFPDIGVHLAIGCFGGALAWGLWCLGLRSIQAEISGLRPFWVWLGPMAIGAVAAVGCFGLEVKHAE